MDKLIPAVMSRLKNYGPLSNLTQGIQFTRNPPDPPGLSKPYLTVQLRDNPDEDGAHGAASNPVFELHVWGYGHNMIPTCYTVAQRAEEALLSGRFSITGGGETMKLRSVLGWQHQDETDPKITHTFAQFSSRYWSRQKIAVLTS